MDKKPIPCNVKTHCYVNSYIAEKGVKIWCCHEHAQAYCDNKNNKSRKISKKDNR